MSDPSGSVPVAVPAVPADELTRTFGVLLIGFIFSVVLNGLTFFQTYIYYTRFPSDSFGTKALVGIVWAVDTCATTLLSHTIYHYLITSFLLAFEQLLITNTFIAEQGLGVFLIFIVQLYYVYRLWCVNDKQIAVPALIGVIAIAACALNLVGVVQMGKQTLFVDIVSSQVKIFRGVAFAFNVVANCAIVGAMLFYMQPTRNPGMALPTDLYERIVVFGFNRGTSFAVTQLLCMIFFLAAPKEQGWILLDWVACRIYANSILAMLNFRNSHRGRGVNEEDSLNQHASNRSGTISAPVNPRETARSVQFSVHPDLKSADPMNIIELDMVPSHNMDDDDVSNHLSLPTSGPDHLSALSTVPAQTER
ncbi:hypothetical protein C8Q74DRAFT_1369673 [Fomes fomentarius]|nr:hypothetical protein C8Q74DRAFT_1369673 [Fomes fomentarius]